MLIIMLLTEKPHRFSDLKRSMAPISQRMLTLTLRNLERDGFVSREVTRSIPPQVDYTLTTLGHSLAVPVEALVSWAMDHPINIAANVGGMDTST